MLYSRNINWPHEDWKNVRHIPPASTGLYARAFTRGSVVKVTRECLKIKVRVSCSEWKCFSRDGTLFSGIYFPLKTCDWRCFDHYKVVFFKTNNNFHTQAVGHIPWKTSTSWRSSELADNRSPLGGWGGVGGGRNCARSPADRRENCSQAPFQWVSTMSHFCFNFPSASL